MYNVKQTLIAIFMFAAFSLIGQTNKPGYLGISPFHFFRNTFVATYETGIGQDKTLLFSPGVILKDNQNESISGFTGELQFRYYLIHPSFEGMDTKLGGARWQPYVAPYYQYSSISKEFPGYYYDPLGGTSKEYTTSRDITAHAGGVLVGCRALLTKNLFVDLTVGGGFRLSDVKDSYSIVLTEPVPVYNDFDIFDYEYKGIAPKVAFTVGIRLY